MGNTNTKESRASGQIDGSSDSRRQDGGRSRLRISRGDLGGLLSLQPARDHGRERPDAPFEHRETRQEREARKLEKERANRAKEREQSVREEHVDGGYLVTMGVYTGTEDFSKQVVRQLQIERKLAPFWRGLNEWSGNWTEHQLIAAARGLPIPPADAPPDPDLMPRPIDRRDTSNSQHSQNLTVPMGPRTLSAASDRSGYMPGSATAATSKTSSIKPRAKALAAALNVGPRTPSVTDLTPKEVLLPHDPHVNGQPIEAFLYKDASDCPICFLSYPPYLNRTRCCDQPICSECFVQIKRADPHLPEHHPNGDVRDPTEVLGPEDPPEMLISEPSACPYCQQAECGVTYEPPPFRRGLVFSAVTPTPASATAMSSQSSLSSTISPPAQQQGGRRRTHSLSASAPNVITTDRVRPDWATKLASARSHQARRAAAATALHTAAFVVGTQETRSILRSGRFGRRSTGPSTPGNEQLVPNSSHTGAADPGPDADAGVDEHGNPNRTAEGGRRSRVEELEDMMFMEAVRLSLAAEEDRKRKEEKALRKEAKKRQSAEKKALKLASKNPYGGNVSGASGSSLSLRLGRRRGNSGASTLRAEAAGQLAQTEARSNSETDKRADHAAGKGKGVDRGPLGSSSGEASSTAGSLAIPVGDSRGSSSHLRQTSNASSFMSSVPDTPSGSYTGPGSTFPRANRADSTSSRPDEEHDSGTEPLFNFRSLAELVGVNLDDGSTQPAGTLRADGIGGGNAKETAAGRPLSQVKEDEKEGAKTEHVESSETTQSLEETTQRDRPGHLLTSESTLVDSDDNNGLSPQVTLTPGTPLAIEEVASGESKQLRSRITEHPADLSH